MNPPPAEGLASRLFVGPALRTQSDRRLVTLVHDGYETAFEEIVRRYGKALGRYAAAIVGGRSEEVTQDAFSKALFALRREDGEREIELRPWLYRIVRNTALNDLRDRPPEPAELGEALAGGRSAAEEVERREEISELLERLQALPEPQRAAIVMRELEGLGHEEIAAALGMSGGAARQAIYRARQTLRDGVGMMIPLPLLRVLIDHGAEAGGAAGAGGAVAAGSAVGGVGAGTALKAGAITAAVLAGGVGAGLALREHRHNSHTETAAAVVRPVETGRGPPPPPLQISRVSQSPSLGGGKSADGEREGGGGLGNGERRRGSRGDPESGGDRGEGGDGSGHRSPGASQHEDGHGGGGPGPPAGQPEPGDQGGSSGSGGEGGQAQGGGFGGGPSPSSGSGGGTSGSGDQGGGGGTQGGGAQGDGGRGGDPGSGDQGSDESLPPPPPAPQAEGSSGSSSGRRRPSRSGRLRLGFERRARRGQSVIFAGASG